ncbi:MAG: NUDIX hydrolase [Planctomycetota bacterium]|nr:NUDIX hydrolase [Planctomycetota bacterium]
MPRDAIPTWFFSVVVVRKGDRFLVVHERKHGQLWFLPCGRVEPGESMQAGAIRETLEETGVPVNLTGILRVEITPEPKYTRVRVVFLAEPKDDTLPKCVPDDESLGAAWVTREELDRLPLRGEEVRDYFAYAAGDPPVLPMALLAREIDPLPVDLCRKKS